MAAIDDIERFGLPGLDNGQGEQPERQQVIINEVMSDLTKQQERLQALDEAIPTQSEQIRGVAKSQREVWEEITKELR